MPAASPGISSSTRPGPRSALNAWLDGAGYPAPREEEVDCDLVYSSRFYRLRPGTDLPPQGRLIGGDVGYLKYAVFPGDNDVFSITFAMPPEDKELRALLKVGPFEAAALALPETAPYRAPGFADPITEVHVHAGLRNRWRDMVADGAPIAPGLIAVGDASSCTNPLYGRGCSLGMVHAFALADTIGAGHAPGSDDLHLAFAEVTTTELRPWFDLSVTQDAASKRARESAASGESSEFDIMREGLLPATQTDPVVLRAFLRMMNLLGSPMEMMQNVEVAGRVLAVYQDRDNRPPPPPAGPPRHELLAAVAAVTGA